MAKGKTIDNVEMSFTDPPKNDNPESAAAPTAAEDLEELKENGQLVFQKNKKTGDIKFFDGDGKEVSLSVIDILEEKYPKIPDRHPGDGSKKKGETKLRFTKEKFNEEKLVMETVEVPFDECDFVTERQDYENADALTYTITKKHHNLVKLLRGEIGNG